MKQYSTLPNAPELELHHQIRFSVISSTLVWFNTLNGTLTGTTPPGLGGPTLLYISSTLVMRSGESLTPLHRCSRRILQPFPQLNRLLIIKLTFYANLVANKYPLVHWAECYKIGKFVIYKLQKIWLNSPLLFAFIEWDDFCLFSLQNFIYLKITIYIFFFQFLLVFHWTNRTSLALQMIPWF